MEDGDDDWDLHAVVRRCTTTTTTTASSLPDKKDLNIDPADTSKQGMNDEPFLSIRSSEMTILPSQTLTISPLSGLHKKQPQQHFSVVNLPKPHRTSNSRPKKRNKISVKKVCHVAAEEVSSDVWSWRKYGQKPIKGSPYPRGYYRCSTSKGCMARKQVERNRSDPGRFILTYTGDHNHPLPTHRSSVSGGSHHMSTGENPTLDDSNIKPLSGKLNMDLDGDFGPLGDDFFEGLEGFTTGGECSKANLDGSGNTFSSSNA